METSSYNKQHQIEIKKGVADGMVLLDRFFDLIHEVRITPQAIHGPGVSQNFI